MDIQKLINEAREYKNAGKLASALSCYNSVMDQLCSEAAEYARSQPDSCFDIGDERRFTLKYFEYTDSYLKRDNVASVVNNNMGVIFAELKDFVNARKSFGESIKYTPDGINYPDPKINLENL
jgi:tetratricopeptide (TPR) repeat protein